MSLQKNLSNEKRSEKTPKGIAADQTIDSSITPADMVSLLVAESAAKGLGGQHIESLNEFYTNGIRQIITSNVGVEGTIQNNEKRKLKQAEIKDIKYNVEFTNAYVQGFPTTLKYKSRRNEDLLPNDARTSNKTYGAKMFISAKVTARANYINGPPVEKVGILEDKYIGNIPVGVGTIHCHTHGVSRENRINMQEDPSDPGGYFIVKGGEWVIDNVEGISQNTMHVHRGGVKEEFCRGIFIGKQGDSFENSYQVVLRYMKDGNITVSTTLNGKTIITMPFYVLFRLFGISRDLEIVQHIVLDVNSSDWLTQSMLEIINSAFFARIRKSKKVKKETVFGADLYTERDAEKILQALAAQIAEPINFGAAAKDQNMLRYLNEDIMGKLDKAIYAHMGQTPEHRVIKMRFFGRQIYKLLCVHFGLAPAADRDSYATKRVLPAGNSLAKRLKTMFNVTIVQDAKRKIAIELENTLFEHVEITNALKSALSKGELEKQMFTSIVTGAKTITVRKSETINRVVSQTLYHKNNMNVIATLNTINSLASSANKQNDRAEEIRRVHPTFIGYIDISSSADSGEKVGKSKLIAISARVVPGVSSFNTIETIKSHRGFIPLARATPLQIHREKLTFISVNGAWIGLCANAEEFAYDHRVARRTGKIHKYVSIVKELLHREINFWTDSGRLVRPLVIVKNNIAQYCADWRAGKRSTKFNQWIDLKKDHIVGLRNGTTTMEDLRIAGIVEYISAEESENCFIAQSIDHLRAGVSDLRQMYTHCDIEQAIYGIVTLAAPLAEHSNATRVTFYGNHRKQSTGWFSLNYGFVDYKGTTLQHYCERSLVTSIGGDMTLPNGHNTIVALMLFNGMNMEDSVVVNKNSVDCGMFNASHYSSERVKLEKGESFGCPDQTKTTDQKASANYSNIDGKFVQVGTLLKKGDVLVVKSAQLSKPTAAYLYADRSLIYKRDERVRVEKVYPIRDGDDHEVVKVKLRANRPIMLGDKVTSVTGNKGIVGAVLPRIDLPYGEDGVVPDIIVNEHSIPTRMAINQLMEAVLGQYAAQKGTRIDASPFSHVDIPAVIALLESKFGIKYGGQRRMYSGTTGDPLDHFIFYGPTVYQRLEKFVTDEKYSNTSGPVDPITHQPAEGKSRDGGLKFGEMEKDCILSRGMARACREKFMDDSDGTHIYICTGCGYRAVVNEKKNLYRCNRCADLAKITKVPSSWSSNLLMNELAAGEIEMKFEVSLPPFYSELPEISLD